MYYLMLHCIPYFGFTSNYKTNLILEAQQPSSHRPAVATLYLFASPCFPILPPYLSESKA